MRSVVFSIILLLTSCGYHFVTPAGNPDTMGKLYIEKIDNRTWYPDLSIVLENKIHEMALNHFTGITTNKSHSICSVRVILSEDRKRTFQSGSDGRSTAVKHNIVVKAVITKKDSESLTYSKQFTVLERFAVQSDLYVNDTEQALRDVSEQIALQVAAWITKK